MMKLSLNQKTRIHDTSRIFTLCFFLAVAVQVSAATIVDTTSPTSGSITVGDFGAGFEQDPLGQSFVLDQAYNNLILGGVLFDNNAHLNPTLDFTISLYSGAGVTGTLLGSKSFTLADGFGGTTGLLHTEDFSFIGTLAAGAYTAAFSTGTGRGGIRYVNYNPYTLGEIYNVLGVFDHNGTNPDLAVLVTANPVPLPTAAWLFGSGLIGLIGFARRKA